jgi:hypothetical protein
MDEDPAARLGALQERTVQARLRAIEANRAQIAELEAIWRDLSELTAGYEDARPLCDEVSADISRLKKLDLALDTEWLADAKRARRQAGTL